ncbi:P450 monooxygenase No.1 [Biscogniauxia marginata]|nr:P450 monooxygenase No.1 [Biscogniauxia marginata]
MAPLHPDDPANWPVIGLSLVITYYVLFAFYQLLLSPLRSFPGPLLWKISLVPRAWALTRGVLPFRIAALHDRYGPIVRVAPNELSFRDANAWREIYGHRAAGEEEFQKYDKFYRIIDAQPHTILTLDRDSHSTIRRQLAHGFSDRSMRGQEPIIGAYVDLLVKRLRENCSSNDAVEGKGNLINLRNWFDWAIFDIIGDLGFGSSFNGLEKTEYHPWVSLINTTVRHSALMSNLTRLGFSAPIQWAFRKGLLPANEHETLVREKLHQRMELGAERPDLIEGLLRNREKSGYSFDQIAANADLLLVAGSETTSTLLGGATYLLATHPDKYARVAKEVRDYFASDEDITLSSVSNLPYMLACLNESLRHYPPVVTGLPRVVPKGGRHIAGKHIPENTVVAVWQWPINHDPRYWTEPNSFVPERWMGEDPKYKGDRFDAMQPFSTGPRNCIGRNLAYAEMRLVLAKLLYNFDITLDDSSAGWLETQKAYSVWDKPQLNVHLKPVTV